ncbi:MAG TPA: FlgD immunoglobulin-like domain containing protein [Acidobacteriota bacterium]|nr:FlgD immunoglobulin-like domain containing protein [Acidobacteriota bacterium]
MKSVLRSGYILVLWLIVGMMLVIPDALGDGPWFAATINYRAGRGPSSVFAIDLDGDGDNDLAVANMASDNVSILFNLSDTYTAIEDYKPLEPPDGFELSQNYPNPFNPSTAIKYVLPQRSHVTIEIFNVLGQRVRTLVDREQSAGAHAITWDGGRRPGDRSPPVCTFTVCRPESTCRRRRCCC